MSFRFSGYPGTSRKKVPGILLSALDVDEGSAPGTLVGNLSMPSGSTGWTYRLLDDASGMFALSGNRIVVGNTALSRDSASAPRIFVVASRADTAAAAMIRLNVRRRLASLPRPSGARILAFGDSQMGYNNYAGPADTVTTSGKAANSYAYGFVEQALSMDPRFNFDSWYDPAEPFGRAIAGANQGIFGDHLSWAQNGGGILGRLPGVLARRPDLLIFEGGTNSINSGDGSDATPATAGYCITQIDACLRLCRDEGVQVILMTLYPRGGWPSGDPRRETMAAVNAWIRAQAGRAGIAGILDVDAILAPGGVLDPSLFFADLVHAGQRGAYFLARDRFLPLLRGLVSAGSVFDQDVTAGNLLQASQAKMQGTGGGKTGAVSGDVASSYLVTLTRNASGILCSKSVQSGDIEAQVLDVTPAALSSASFGELSLTLPIISTGLPKPGQWLRFHIFVEVDDVEAISFARGNLQILNGSTVKAQTMAMNGFSPDFDKPLPGGRGWWVSTKPLQIQSDEVFDRIRCTVQLHWPKSAAPFRAKISRPILRIVSDPRPAWNY